MPEAPDSGANRRGRRCDGRWAEAPPRIIATQARRMSSAAVRRTRVAAMARYANAWYWEGLGLGRLAGLHRRQTDCPQGTVTPQRTHRSYSFLISVTPAPLPADVD